MKSWFDTEFIEDGKTIDLLSIGIVREDGQEYYAVSRDADLSKASDWVKENVLSKMSFDGAKPRHQIREEVEKFLRADGTKPEIWGYYADYDWVVLCQLFGRMIDLPKGFPMYCRDVKQLCAEVGNPTLPKQGIGEHHALFDANWTKEAWAFCEERRRIRKESDDLLRKILWILARQSDTTTLQIPEADLVKIPDEAELMTWKEQLFDAVMIKAICKPINQPEISRRVHGEDKKP